MNWKVQYAKTFLREMARLPNQVRPRVEAIVFGPDVIHDPFLQGRVQKLTGYQHYYKVQVGNYRIGLYINPDDQIVEFQRVLHRRDIYRKFP